MPDRLTDPVAIVTGAGGGLGLAIAERLAAAGSRVVVAERDEAAGRAAAARLPGALAIPTDIGDPASVTAMVTRTQEQCGRIDILVNNAAVTGKHPAYRRAGLLDTSLDFWRWLIEINLTAQFVALQAVARVMAAQRSGVIVNVSSIAGLLPTPGDFTYAIAKAGVLALTRNAAADLSARNIRVNAVAPSGFGPTQADPATAQTTELGQVIDLLAVAESVAFLCSPAAQAISGQVLTIDGGESVAGRYGWPPQQAPGITED